MSTSSILWAGQSPFANPKIWPMHPPLRSFGGVAGDETTTNAPHSVGGA